MGGVQLATRTPRLAAEPEPADERSPTGAPSGALRFDLKSTSGRLGLGTPVLSFGGSWFAGVVSRCLRTAAPCPRTSLRILSLHDNLARAPHQGGDEPILDRRQVPSTPSASPRLAARTKLELAELALGLVGPLAQPGGMAQGDADARQQLPDAEGLRQVVVRAGVEGLDLVALLPAGGEHDDGHARPLAQPAGDLDAVQVGKPEVEQHQVGHRAEASSRPLCPVSASISR